MSAINTVQTLNGLFKEVYADAISKLVPDGVKLLNDIPFSEKQKLGKSYNVPVLLQLEHGVTFIGEDEDGVDLNEAVSAAMKNASVKGSGLMLRSKIGLQAAARAANGGKAAFVDATKLVVENMVRSMAKKLEILMFYGQAGLGTSSAPYTIDTTGVAVVIPAAEFAPGIWAGAKDMKLDAYDVSGSALLTSSSNYLTVVSVDLEARSVVLKCQSGTIALDTGDSLWFYGARTNSAFKEMKGVHAILDYSGSDLFGIDNSQYELWKAPEYNVAGALSFNKINEAISLAIAKGLDGDVTVYISNASWDDLMSDIAALRSFDQTYDPSKAKQGHKAIEFFSKNGMIRIVPSIHVKGGYGYVLSLDCWERVGSTDVTFRLPGRGDEFFELLENAHAYQLKAMSDFSVFCHRPGHNVLLKGIA